MKYLTITVPCFNSEEYLERCIESLLIGGEKVEIIIVDDGSTDRTGEIADRYESEYPDVVRAVHKGNGGHGSGVNAGLKLAVGTYFKVVDSDDWLEESAYRKLLQKLEKFCKEREIQKEEERERKIQKRKAKNPESKKKKDAKQEKSKKRVARQESQKRKDEMPEIKKRKKIKQENPKRKDWRGKQTQVEEAPDLLICNYTYNHLEENKKKTISYRNVFPVDQVCTWEDMKRFHPSQYLVMHSLIFRTDILRKSGVILPEHTFYVDNLFSYRPLPYVETLYYLDINLYQYYLGREDQSVNEKVLTSRIEQQIKVTKMVSKCVDLKEVKKRHPKLADYMYRNISIMMAISSIHLLLRGDEKAKKRHKEIWSDIKKENPGLYYRLRYTKLSGLTNLPGRLGKIATVRGYQIAKKIYKFQ